MIILMTNRKLCTRFRLVPKSMTFDDLEQPFRTRFQNTCVFGAHHENFNEDRQQQNVAQCLSFWQYNVYADIRGVPWRRGVKRQWGNRKRHFQGFRALRLRHLRKWGQHYYIVLFSPLSPFHWAQNTWPWMTLNGHFTLNFHYYEPRFQQLGYTLIVEPIYKYFCRMTSPAEMCGSGPWSAEYCGSVKGLRIFRKRKVAGANLNK